MSNVNNLTYSPKGLQLTESFEGFRQVAYNDPLHPGLATVGWGHTGPDVVVGSVWTMAQCEAALMHDTMWAAGVVNTHVLVPLNQNQFDALLDFVYNVGSGNFMGSTLLKLVNMNQMGSAALEFLKWNKAKGVPVLGLTRRRSAEMKLFTS